MTTQTEISSLAVKVGEISGQLREFIHSVNNMAQKVDGMTGRFMTADPHLVAARVIAFLVVVALVRLALRRVR